MPIKPEVLKTLRKRKKLSRQQLAERTKLSLRQLARLESGTASSTKVRERTLEQLAKALGVEQGVLTGEQALPEAASILEERADQGERVQVSAALLPEVRLAYSLIQRRYGVNMTTIINSAPLLFILLAEKSLAWRREKLKAVNEAIGKLEALADGHPFFVDPIRSINAATDEEDSIGKLDLFGEHIGQDEKYGYDASKNNPFADYLRELAGTLDNPDIITMRRDEVIWGGPTHGFPEHDILKGELARITGGSVLASLVLKWGHARIDDIPDELLAEDAAERRAKWLEAKLPERVAQELDAKIEAWLAAQSEPLGELPTEDGR